MQLEAHKVSDKGEPVDIWLCPEPEILDPGLAAAYAQLLNATELARWQRFRFVADRNRYLLARALVRTVLGNRMNLPAADVQFAVNRWGKPELDPQVYPDCAWQFNLSHTSGLVVLALGKSAAVGVDVEDTRRKVELPALAQRYFSGAEVDDLLALPAGLMREHFFRLWTLKEAYLKALGLGLRIPLTQFSFSCGEHCRPTLDHPQSDLPANHWQFESTMVEHNFRLALAIAGDTSTPSQVRMFRGLPLQPFLQHA